MTYKTYPWHYKAYLTVSDDATVTYMSIMVHSDCFSIPWLTKVHHDIHKNSPWYKNLCHGFVRLWSVANRRQRPMSEERYCFGRRPGFARRLHIAEYFRIFPHHWIESPKPSLKVLVPLLRLTREHECDETATQWKSNMSTVAAHQRLLSEKMSFGEIYPHCTRLWSSERENCALMYLHCCLWKQKHRRRVSLIL